MISSEVQRTLVKSPPELWAELSDPASLARHLGELGDIRIVRAEPESTVEWEAENTTGKVSIKASGWGTKVTLSVNRELPRARVFAEPASAPEPEPESVPAPEPAAEIAPERLASPEPVSSPQPASPPEPVSPPKPVSPPESRRGFFARLFDRFRQPAPRLETPTSSATVERLPGAREPRVSRAGAFAAISEALALETFAGTSAFDQPAASGPEPAESGPPEPAESEPPEPAESGPPEPAESEPIEPVESAEPAATKPSAATSARTESEPSARRPEGEPAVDLAAELRAAEEAAADEVRAVLTSVLDRLGAAHHRPFSRA